jgi:hypothetical protein
MLTLATEQAPAQIEEWEVLLRRTMVDLRKTAEHPDAPGYVALPLKDAADLLERMLRQRRAG